MPRSSRPAPTRAEALIARIAALHSYDVPATRGLADRRRAQAYADWVEGETDSGGSTPGFRGRPLAGMAR